MGLAGHRHEALFHSRFWLSTVCDAASPRAANALVREEERGERKMENRKKDECRNRTERAIHQVGAKATLGRDRSHLLT